MLLSVRGNEWIENARLGREGPLSEEGGYTSPGRMAGGPMKPLPCSGNQPPWPRLKFTVTIMRTSMGLPLSRVGSYFHCATACIAA